MKNAKSSLTAVKNVVSKVTKPTKATKSTKLTKATQTSMPTMRPVTAFFDKKAAAALTKAANRMADLRFFEQVLDRLKVGQGMSKELAAFKRVDNKTALKTVKVLIKRCQDELVVGYWTIKSRRIVTKVKTEFVDDELVPRYTVLYKIATKSGEVSIQVETAGVTVEVHTNNKKCRGVTEEQALDQVMQELVLAGLR